MCNASVVLPIPHVSVDLCFIPYLDFSILTILDGHVNLQQQPGGTTKYTQSIVSWYKERRARGTGRGGGMEWEQCSTYMMAATGTERLSCLHCQWGGVAGMLQRAPPAGYLIAKLVRAPPA